jgi:two-component system sensor histidine kinase ChiS
MHRFIKNIFSLILFPILLHAQQRDIKFEHLSLQHGLSQSTIRCIFQDSRGFIWIGTQDGLNRYDGYHFKVNTHNLNDSTSVSSSIIYLICEDQKGNLWIGTDGGGFNKFDPQQNKFTHNKRETGIQNTLSHNFVISIYEDTLI